ncbi:MAG: hypothetical protein ACOX9E_02820 [Lentisphaeria bacterium]|jgi:hypothetical protein
MSTEATAKNVTTTDAGADNGTASASGATAGSTVCCSEQGATSVAGASTPAGAGSSPSSRPSWLAGIWRVLLAYLLGVGVLALLMVIMRRAQQ